MSCAEAAPTLCCCLQHGSGFRGPAWRCPIHLTLYPRSREQSRGCRHVPPWRCRSAVAVRIQHGNAAPAAAALMCGTEKKNLPFQLLHYRGWRPGGRVSLYCLLLGREKKSSGPQLPRKVEAKVLSSVTDLSSFHESPLPAINLSLGNPCLPPRFPSLQQSV